jgi:hypothetical protein
MSRPRRIAGTFLSPNGLRRTPLREIPSVADEQELVDRIRDAKTIRDEPECVGPAILASYAEVNARICTQQHVVDVANAQQLRPLLKAEDRLRDIRRRAKYAHVDLSHETHILARELERARVRAQPVPGRVVGRIERLEGLLDGIAA